MWGVERREFFFFFVSLLAAMAATQEIQIRNNIEDFLGSLIQRKAQVVQQPIEEIIASLGLSTSDTVRRLLRVTTVAQELQNITNIQDVMGRVRQRVAQVEQQAIEDIIPYLGLSTCEGIKTLLGVSYEQLKKLNGPDLNNLTLVYRFGLVTKIFYLNDAVEVLQGHHFNEGEDFVMYLHGLTDDPYQERFGNISEAYLNNGHMLVAALDAGPLLRDQYFRAATFVRFIGERLGKVLVTLAQHGQNPDRIHLIGHSLGAHTASFAGKTFYKETGIKIRRITGLDPAGPCFGQMEPDLRLKASDAKFVDVIHTNAGEYGTMDTVGHADYFPNGGSLQPSCVSLLCSHERSWLLYSVSVKKPHLFPAVKCNDWDDFKNDRCSDEISYMGFGAEPTTGKFYLKTSGEYPYGLGEEGLNYRNMNGAVKNIHDTLHTFHE